jgi:hypothetical protein
VNEEKGESYWQKDKSVDTADGVLTQRFFRAIKQFGITFSR